MIVLSSANKSIYHVRPHPREDNSLLLREHQCTRKNDCVAEAMLLVINVYMSDNEIIGVWSLVATIYSNNKCGDDSGYGNE